MATELRMSDVAAQGLETTRQRIERLMSPDYVRGSMIAHEPNVVPLLKYLKPQMIVEIGTHWGNSAVLWASHCQSVVTFDIFHCETAYELWKKAGLAERIAMVQIRDDAAKERLLANLDFDFAFVDGEHTVQAVERDFNAVKKAGAVLFHDYKPTDGEYANCKNQRYPELAAYLDSLSPRVLTFGPRCSRMALWLNPDRMSTERREEVASLCRASPFL